MSTTLDIRVKKANKVYYEGVSLYSVLFSLRRSDADLFFELRKVF